MLLEILRISVYTLSLFGALVILIHRNQLGSAFRWTGWFLLFAGLSQIAAYLMALYLNSNIVLYNSAVAINFGLLYGIFHSMMRASSFRLKINAVFVLGGIGVILFLIPAFTEYFASRSLTVINIVITISCLSYFYELLKIPETTPITRQGKFWIAAAFLVHHVSSFTIWMVYEIKKSYDIIQAHGILSVVFANLLYLMLLIAVVVQVKNPKYGH